MNQFSACVPQIFFLCFLQIFISNASLSYSSALSVVWPCLAYEEKKAVSHSQGLKRSLTNKNVKTLSTYYPIHLSGNDGRRWLVQSRWGKKHRIKVFLLQRNKYQRNSTLTAAAVKMQMNISSAEFFSKLISGPRMPRCTTVRFARMFQQFLFRN